MTARLKHRWSVGHNYLAGICAEDWWPLLRANRFAVDAAYAHRAALVSALSVVNSWHRRREEARFARRVERVRITQPPLFVLGHWRSGTTHLHNLLALDTDQFAYPNTYQVTNPHTFLTTEAVNTRRFAFLLPPKRPMDDMALSFQSPQEDEFALLLGCLLSPYLGVTFPRREAHYSRYLTLRDVPADEVARWKATFLWFARKLTLHYGARALVYKSPPHTARVRLLCELFPEARFVHIRRDPYTVYRSFQHYFDTASWYTYLQRPDLDGIDRRILERYLVLHDAYVADRPLIAPGRLHELTFEDLESDPLGQMRLLYERLALPGFERIEPRLRAYVSSLAGYAKNRFAPLTDVERAAVATAWQRSFATWGYPM